MSGIAWTQSYPIPPTAYDYYLVGFFDAVNGIGPYTWTIDNGASNTGRYTLGTAYERMPRNTVRVWYYQPGTGADTITLHCTDGRGDTFSRTVSVNKSASGVPTIAMNYRNPLDNSMIQPGDNDQFKVDCEGGTHGSGDTAVYSGSGIGFTKWIYQYGKVSWYAGTTIPLGTYPITATFTDSGGLNPVSLSFNMGVVAFKPITWIEFVPAAVSTSSVSGGAIGKALATTPNDDPTWSINDNGLNAFRINAGDGTVRLVNQISTAGSYPYSITVTDGNATYTQNFNLTVAAGTTLPASNMSMTLNAFTNYFFRAHVTQRPVGTPSVTGFPTPANVRWSITKMQRWNWAMDTPGILWNAEGRGGGSNGYPRFGCNPLTGATYVQAHLSDTTATPGEWFDLTATDGVYTCTKRFYLQVSAVVGPIYHVGQGMSTSAPGGTTGFEHLKDALAGFIGWERDVTAIAGAHIYVHYNNANPNHYVEDWFNFDTWKQGLNGPYTIEGVVGAGGELPYIGAARGASKPISLPGDKAIFCSNNGDATYKNLELGFIHQGLFGGDGIPAGNNTMALIRQNSGCSGDIRIDNCDLHDADVPIEAGSSDGQWIITRTRISNGSASTSAGGANQHNAYIGHIWNIVVDHVLSQSAAAGHVFKCRATQGTWTNSRFYDGARGSGFNAFQLPCGGSHTITNCEFQGGPMKQNPYIIQFADEVGNDELIYTQDYVHSLSMSNCKVKRQYTTNFSPNAMNIQAVNGINTGARPVIALDHILFEGVTAGSEVVLYDWVDPVGTNLSGVLTNTSPTYTTGHTAMDFTTPCTYNCGRPGWHDAMGDLDNPTRYPYIGARQMDPGTDEIRISASASPGTIVCSAMQAYGAPNYSLSGHAQPDPLINPFVAGTVWGPGQTNTLYTGVSWGWDTAKYTFASNSDGTGKLIVGASGLGGVGCDKVLVRATAPNGRIVEWAFPVVKF